MVDYCLYILMRTDMDSMNPGKACAQAAHAANHFVRWCESEHEEILSKWWQQTGRGFGTTIVLGVQDGDMLDECVSKARSTGYLSGSVRDPSYPVQDGLVTHLLDITTCGWVFGNREDLKFMQIMEKYSLLP